MLVFLNRLIRIFIALLVSPFIIALALFLLLLKLVYFFRRPPLHKDRGHKKNGDLRGRIAQRKVLILQSAEPAFVLKALDRLNSLPLMHNSRCTFFCRNRSEVLKHFVGHPMLHQILPHVDIRRWWEHFDRLRREHFDVVAVFFTGDPSYWKIKYFSFLLGGRRRLVFDENGDLISSRKALFALFERDLILAGIFQSIFWKMRPGLRWLAEHYQLIRARSHSFNARKISKQILSTAGFPAKEAGTGTASSEAAHNDQKADPQQAVRDSRQMLTRLSKTALDYLLSSPARYRLPRNPEPEVSVILVLFNRAELTFQCLRSLVETGYESMEIIIVDNNSSDDTAFLLDRLEGATILRNSENIHFLKAANAASCKARGRYLLFLNNDTQVLPGSIQAAVNTLERADDIGAVGGRLILPDGTLQEAGNIVWRDGSCLGYGRGDDPFASEYMFRRDVDYCSGAFLLTRRETFMKLGGFDEAYQPFYYEETDFCLRLWDQGLRVVYEPEAAILHYEFASSSSSEEAQEWHARHQGLFRLRHRDRLQHHYDPDDNNVLPALDASRKRRRVLFIEDRVPHPALGSGFPRANTVLSSLAKLDCFITLYPTAVIDEKWSDVYADISREVEVIRGYGPDRLHEFLASRIGYYDYMLVSRPHNMQYARPILQAHRDWFQETRIIYDAEALFAARELANLRLMGKGLDTKSIEQLMLNEVELAAEANLVVAVSRSEAEEFARYGIQNIRVLGHALAVAPTPRAFEDRTGFLFVGPILEENSPNGDAVLWFLREILPAIRNRLGCVPFTVAGVNRIDLGSSYADSQLRVLGRVEDLSATYNEARVFVTPTRFAAGIPHKIHEAAAHGVPVVATSLLMHQLGWIDGTHLLVADQTQAFAEQCIRLYSDAPVWERIRRGALHQVRVDCSPESFEATLKSIFQGAA